MQQTIEHQLQEIIQTGILLFDVPVKDKFTLKIGGRAKVWAEPGSVAELQQLLRFCSKENLSYYMVGNGSNILLKDSGYSGVLIRLSAPAFKKIEKNGTELRCGGGVTLNELLARVKEEGLSGAEFFTGIPGTVGGALSMNAGAHGGCTADILKEVEYLRSNGERVVKAGNEIQFGYRSAPEFKASVILWARFQLKKGYRADIRNRIKELNSKRSMVTPPNFNAGCIFKNSNGESAGAVIDACGLKGLKVGEAQVSLKHGNYFVNLGNATSKDLLLLIDQVREKVFQARGIKLETEIRVIGE